MRNFILALFLCLPLLSGAQWVRLTDTYVDDLDLHDICAKGNKVWGVGYSGLQSGTFIGYIFQSKDGGKTWDTTEIPGQLMKTIAFKDADTAFIAGFGNISLWYRSVDGGDNWELFIADQATKGVTDMVFFSDKVGMAAGYGDKQFFSGNCFITTDGGYYWAESDANDPVLDTIGIDRMFFLDQQTGYGINNLFGGKYLIKTENSGKNFSLLHTHNTFIGDVYFWNVSNGIMVDFRGKIFKTTDGGKNWVEKTSPVSTGLNSIVFLNDKMGYIAGDNGVIISTTDGGETWTKEKTNTTARLFRLRSLDGTLYASGSHGTILKKGWPNNVKETSVAYKLNIYPNPASSVLNISAVNGTYKSVSAQLFDLTGKSLMSGSTEGGVIKMDIQNIPAGVYMVSVTADGQSHTEKIIIQH